MADLRVVRPLLPGVHARSVGLLAALLVLCGLGGPSVALATPVATFTVNPASPQTNQTVTLTADQADNPAAILPLTYRWSTDGGALDATSGRTVHITFATAGTYHVTLTVTDPNDPVSGVATSTKAITATDPPPPNAPPAASFTFSPPAPRAGSPVTFTSTSTDPDGDPITLAWDLNQNGLFNDGTGTSAQRTFTSPGTYAVGLRVTDSHGLSSTATQQVTVVADIPPKAGFGFTPSAPRAGQPVTFSSTSTDPDGTIAALAWDLNGDGRFDDATGQTAQRAFPAAGSYNVSLRVTDDNGLSSIAFKTISVLGSATQEQDALAGSTPGTSAPDALPPATPVPSPGTSSPRRPTLLSPFPIIRIRGRSDATAVVVDVLTVQAPRGSRISARCRGASCPRRASAAVAISSSRPVRLRGLERRYGYGVVLEVRVTMPGRIGKYTGFSMMHRGKAPQRRDLCLRPGTTRPSRCPTQ
jgi:PKD repeat protein